VGLYNNTIVCTDFADEAAAISHLKIYLYIAQLYFKVCRSISNFLLLSVCSYVLSLTLTVYCMYYFWLVFILEHMIPSVQRFTRLLSVRLSLNQIV